MPGIIPPAGMTPPDPTGNAGTRNVAGTKGFTPSPPVVTYTPPQSTSQKLWGMAPRARQLYLRSKGFNVKVDGNSGPQTASAAWSLIHGHDANWFNHQGADWQQSIWNQHFAKYHPDQKPSSSPTIPTHKNNTTPPVDPGKNGVSGSGGGTPPPAASGLPDTTQANIDSLSASAGSGTMLNPKLGALVGKMVDSKAAGAAAAEAGFGQAIRDAGRTAATLPGQGRQDQADIKSWYGKLAARQAGNATADAAMADQQISNQQGAAAGLANAMGGSASAAATDIGAAGDASVANLRALKLIGAQGNSELSSAIGAEGLSARTRQRILDDNALTAAKNKVSDLGIQSGAAATQASQQADAANTSLAQQRYANKIGAIGANNQLVNDRAQRTAAAISAQEAGAMVPYQQAASNASAVSTVLRAQTAAQRSITADHVAAAKSLVQHLPKGVWDNTSSSDKGKVADAAVGAAHSIMANKGTVEQAVQTVNNLYRSRGWSLNNPRVVRAVIADLTGAGVKVNPKWWAKFGYKG